MGRKEWPRGAWSHSRFEVLRRCPRAHKIKYVERIVPLGLPPFNLEVGVGFHRVLEAVGNAVMLGEDSSPERWDAAVLEARGKCSDGKAALEVTRLGNSYQQRWGCANAGYPKDCKLIGVEKTLFGGTLHAAMGGYAAIADGLCEGSKGLEVYEHKTAARMPSGSYEEVVRKLKVGSQACSLAYCAWKTLGEIPCVVRNIITKTKVPDVARFTLKFTEDELLKWEQDQVELEQLVGLTCANRDACAPVVGFECDYLAYCHGTEADKELYGPRVSSKE